MTRINTCPDCGKNIFKNNLSCTCGWSQVNERPKIADRQCRYQHNGRRCPFLGTMSAQLYGSGSWYCSGHWHTLDDPKLAVAVLSDAEKNYRKTLDKQGDWRRNLFTKEISNEK